MDQVLWFQGPAWDNEDYDETIEGEKFQELMGLCFDRADKFSLLRTDWPKAKDGPLEQALRPYLLGEYLSYSILHWFDREARQKCYIYRANEETKAILLSHITHLFGRDVERSDGSGWPPEKYKRCVELSEAAYERVMERWDVLEAATGRPVSEEESAAIEQEELREARELWLQIFDEADFDSNMEDPCFFQGDEMFFWTLTHEIQCCAWVVDQPFGERLRALGRWVEEDKTRSLGRLSGEDGLVWYDAAGNA